MQSIKELDNLKSMSLGDHLDELRSRLILALTGFFIGLVGSFFFGKMFLHQLLKPFAHAIEKAGGQPSLQAIDVAEPFMVYLKASMVLAILITSPWIIYQVWAFISSGLYKHEKKFLYAVTPASAILFITGTLFFLVYIAPLALAFFIRFNTGIDYLHYQPSLTKYINFVLTLSLVFGLAFQSPIAIIFAERMGLVTVEALVKYRKYVLLAIVIIAAIATPTPDMVSQIALAVPLYILYEASIIICRILRKKRQEAAA